MKKTDVIKLCMALLMVLGTFFPRNTCAQNVYDTYNPWNPTMDSIVDPYPYENVVPNFIGEYQLFTDGLEAWQNTLVPSALGFSISYRIEPVGFPFVPDCSQGCGDSTSTTRNLIMPSTLNSGEYVFEHPFAYPSDSMTTMSDPAELMSNAFTRLGPVSGGRDLLPHTAIKHTYYLHASADPNSQVLDSFSFVLDHTRGFMSEYPFRPNNGPTSELQHDVTIIPWFIYPDVDSFMTSPAQTGNFMNTYNYYPYPNSFYYPGQNPWGWNLIPDPSQPNDIYNAPHFYGHAAPYSLLGIMLGNAGLSAFAGSTDTIEHPGVAHTYYIDKALDFRKINPHEKIIYNPSKVYITATQPVVFPSGYTFMNVGGKYPTASQLTALDPNNMYGDPTKIPVIETALNLTDNLHTSASDAISLYEVMPGCTLTIESCVTLYDCKITVDSGAVIQFDSSSVFGNWSLAINPGGTQIQLSNDPTVACKYLCYEESNYNDRLVHITSNTTWDTTNIESSFPGSAPWSAAQNNTAKFVEGIVIDSGATLTVEPGVTLLFGPLAKVIVKKGGRFVLEGDSAKTIHLGPACQMEWKGIEVWGNPDSSQQAVPSGITPQGWLSMEYCIIDHAHDAVTLGCPDTSGREGGVINAHLCSFLNNVRDVVFLPYRNFSPTISGAPTLNNKSTLTSSEFRTTEYFFDPTLNADHGVSYSAATAHVAMYGVKGVTFQYCTFANDNPLDYDPHLRGIGIYGLESGLVMRAQYPSTFENLSDAVWMQSSGLDGKVVNITGSVFTNNIHSIVLEGTRFSAIFRNEIDVPESPVFGYTTDQLEKGYDKPVGIFLLGSVDYNVWENEFNVGDTASQLTPVSNCDNCCYDIVVYHSAIQDSIPPYLGVGTGRIYKNVIHHSSIGIQVQGNNGQGLSANGMEVMCNEFDERMSYDFIAAGRSGLYPVFTTLRDQGYCNPNNPELQATNYFLQSCSSQEQVNASTNTQQFIYSDKTSTYPSCYNIMVDLCPGPDTNSCQSLLTWGWYQPVIAVKYNVATDHYQTARYYLDTRTDCGSTEDLLNLIDTESGDALNTDLLECSPYLSDEVLIALLDEHNREKLSEEQLLYLLLEHGRLSAAVWDAVLNTSPEIREEGMNALIEGQEVVGDLENLQREWQTWMYQADMAAAELTAHALINDSLDGAIAVLDSTSAIPEMQKLFILYLAAGDSANAESTLDSILTLQKNENNAWSLMAEAALTQANEGRSWLSVNHTEFLLADSIWNANPEMEFGTRAVVAYYTHERFAREPFGLESEERRSSPMVSESVMPQPTPSLRAYPNPTDKTVTIIAQSETDAPMKIEVLNTLGQKVSEVSVLSGTPTEIDVADYPPGMLYLRLISQDICLATEKLMISR